MTHKRWVKRLMMYGPTGTSNPRTTKFKSIDAIFDHCMPIPESGCWVWQGSIHGSGYGAITIRGKSCQAHRVSFELSKGPIPAGLEIDHLCRVRSCVNPAHLEAVTNKVNVLRGIGCTAVHAKKTHCPKGHPLAEGNLVPSSLIDGRRDCLICSRTRASAAYYRKKLERDAVQS